MNKSNVSISRNDKLDYIRYTKNKNRIFNLNKNSDSVEFKKTQPQEQLGH